VIKILEGKIIEINKKASLAGRTPVKFILNSLYNSDSEYNGNGISFQAPYCEQNLLSVKNMPLIASFLDDSKEIPFGGHGNLQIKDGEVIFEDSLVVGAFESATIEQIEVNNQTINAVVGSAYIFDQRFPHLVDYLQEEYDNNRPVTGSVEICADKSEGNTNIVYVDGYKPQGRIPEKFQYSGYAILVGEIPSDNNCLLVELNKLHNNIDNIKDIEVDDLEKNKTIKQSSIIETNELNYEDICSLIIRAFNKQMNPNDDNSYYWDNDYFIYRFYPTRVVMKKYGEIGTYYMALYTINNTEVELGEIIEVTEDWVPIGETPVEINMEILQSKFNKGGKKMDKMLKEKDDKILEQATQIAELNSKIETFEKSSLELNTKITELNTTIVEVNKTLEQEKTEKESITTEINSLREFKIEVEKKEKEVEINTYFINEVSKNGFTEVELNTLKTEYVEKVDFDGLKKAEANLCIQKFKEMNAVKAELNTKTDDNALFMSIHNTEKSDEDYSDLF